MTETAAPLSFQEMILRLHSFWSAQGCLILQPYDMRMGAGTFHPATTLRALGPEPWQAAYVQPSRRPTDGRYGENPNRLQHYYQYQVILKPNPENLQELYLESLAAIGVDPLAHDIRFVEDDWESPTLGAWGLGWEVWCDGMEVTQFTYFQQVGGFDCKPVAGELTYGLERLAMYIQGVDNVYDLKFNDSVSYGQVFLENEKELSKYNFEIADTEQLFKGFQHAEAECRRCIDGASPARRLRSGDRGEPSVQPAASARGDFGAGTRELHRPGARSRQGQLPGVDRPQQRGMGGEVSGVDGMMARFRSSPFAAAQMGGGARSVMEGFARALPLRQPLRVCHLPIRLRKMERNCHA